MNNKITLTTYDGKEIKQGAIDLKEAIEKNRNDLVFKLIERDDPHNHSQPRNFNYFDVFHEDDLTFRVGSIGQLNDGNYWVWYVNMDCGRWCYEAPEYIRRSINIKSTTKIAVKSIKTPNFDYIQRHHFGNFGNHINSKKNHLSWEMHQQTGGCPDFVINEMFKLIESGYKSSTLEFMEAMKYLVENKENIDKYRNFDPDYYGVWVQPKRVVYRKKDSKEDLIVADRNQLPEAIKDKMAVLDIMEKKDYIEEVGLRDEDNIYWVMV